MANPIAPPEETVPVGEGKLRQVILELSVISGAHMPKADFTGGCDPFCLSTWEGKQFRTDYKAKQDTPVWDEKFSFPPLALRGSPADSRPEPAPLCIELYDYDSVTAQDLLGKVELPADFMAQVVLAPQNWSAEGTFGMLDARLDVQSGAPLKGHDGEATVITIGLKVSWTEDKDPDYDLKNSQSVGARKKSKGFIVKVAEDPLEVKRREREEEERERAERAEAKKRAGPTFFGGGRLGNAVEIETAARNGENWSKRNVIVLNSDKRREAHLRALAAAETRRLGSSGRVPDKQRAALVQSVLADGNSQVGRALQESCLMTNNNRMQSTLADAATRRLQTSQLRGFAQPRVFNPLPAKGHLPAPRIPYTRAAEPKAEAPPCADKSVFSVPEMRPDRQTYAHREGLLTAADLDRYASELGTSTQSHDAQAPQYAPHRAWGGGIDGADLYAIRSAASAVNYSTFLGSPRGYEAGRPSTYAAAGLVNHADDANRDDESDDLLARARQLIAAGQAVSAVLGRSDAGEQSARAETESQFVPNLDRIRNSGPQLAVGIKVQKGGQGRLGFDRSAEDADGENEQDGLRRIREIARSILGCNDDVDAPEDGESEEEEEKTQVLEDDGWAPNLQTSFGKRLAGIHGGSQSVKEEKDNTSQWHPWMEESGLRGEGGGFCEPSTATLPSVRSRAESDLSEGIPIAGGGGGKLRGHGGWGMVCADEEEVGEQRVLLQGIRLRGLICGREDNPEISFMLKIDMGGFKCRTDKARRLRGEVSWTERCELDLVGATATLRIRVVRCRQPRSASQSVDSVVGECMVPVDQLEGSDRAVSWGWHRILGLGVGGDTTASGEIYLGVERFRVPDAAQEADRPVTESKGTMPDEELAPDLDDPLSKAGASAVLQRGWRCHAARRDARATVQWRESLQRKSHRAFPGSLNGLQPPNKSAAVATALTKPEANSNADAPREGAAAMYTRRQPPPARNLAFAPTPGQGKSGMGVGPGATSFLPGSGREYQDAGVRGGGRGSLVPLHPTDAAARSADAFRGGAPGQVKQFPLDALFPLGRASKSAFRLPPPAGITDTRGPGGAAERSWAGGGEGQAGLYRDRVGQGDRGFDRAVGGSDLGGVWDKIHGAAAHLLQG